LTGLIGATASRAVLVLGDPARLPRGDRTGCDRMRRFGNDSETVACVFDRKFGVLEPVDREEVDAVVGRGRQRAATQRVGEARRTATRSGRVFPPEDPAATPTVAPTHRRERIAATRR